MDEFAETPKLPVSFRGYDRDATEGLLRQLEAGYRTLLVERDQREGRVAELERELAEHRERSRAVGNALIKAEELKALSARDAQEVKEDAEREAGEIRAQAEQHAEALRAAVDTELFAARAAAQREAEAAAQETYAAKAKAEQEAAEIRARAAREADEVVREAESRAARLVAAVERELQERQHEAEDFLDDTRERLSSLVRDLFGRATRSTGEGAGTDAFVPESAFESPLDRDSSAGT